jgi:hypothetical protein
VDTLFVAITDRSTRGLAARRLPRAGARTAQARRARALRALLGEDPRARLRRAHRRSPAATRSFSKRSCARGERAGSVAQRLPARAPRQLGSRPPCRACSPAHRPAARARSALADRSRDRHELRPAAARARGRVHERGRGRRRGRVGRAQLLEQSAKPPSATRSPRSPTSHSSSPTRGAARRDRARPGELTRSLGEHASLIAHHWRAAGARYGAARWRRAALRVSGIQLPRAAPRRASAHLPRYCTASETVIACAIEPLVALTVSA